MDMRIRRSQRLAALVVAAGCLLAGCGGASGDGALAGKADGQQGAGMAKTRGAAGGQDGRLMVPSFWPPVPSPPQPLAPSPSPSPAAAVSPVPVEPEERAQPQGPRTAYLTFDDGPSGSTRKILDILKQHEVKATFFVVGSETAEARALYRRINAEGHALGNHTYSHDYRSIYKSAEAFKRDVARLDRLLEETVGVRPDIFRFPGGSNNHLSRKSGGPGIMKTLAREMTASGYTYFDWNVSSTDAAAPVQDRELIIQSVLGASRGKRSIIVLMHDNTFKTTTLEALPVVIRELKQRGFRFDKLTSSSFAYRFLEP
ncbi:polysaccharide deacetylase [Paenibacillus athensensis]|uniref:NodB homology domain-containing protein n=1 Tax=Paenibacillus athensensis TaxID=1967502 RepID=A0A4Y8Q2I1_9BACL|nr:polysaccharide deacetylase family protein [Paenibacillus athensensis]MCD1258715.1 polysaccharide deacetylase [Paenibacillus athensensis]